MKTLKPGEFYGMTNETIHLEGITLTDTEYTHEKVDWHYHENAYFTFLLEGNLLEGNKKSIYTCSAGSLLFHNWQEAHYNVKPHGFARGFHIELEPKWFDAYELKTNLITGSINLSDPQYKVLMYNIFKEVKSGPDQSAIDSLLIELFSRMTMLKETIENKKPTWVARIKEILNESDENLSLSELSALVNIHPVHLSREFSRYFNCKLGDYLRSLKVQRALTMLPQRDLSMTRIAFQSNFADQSHFIRSFKTLHNITPSSYRKLFLKGQKG